MAESNWLRVHLVLGPSTGGIGTHVHSLARHLVLMGCRVTVCGPAQTQAQFRFTDVGADFLPVAITPGTRPLRDVTAVRALRRVVDLTRVPSEALVHAERSLGIDDRGPGLERILDRRRAVGD